MVLLDAAVFCFLFRSNFFLTFLTTCMSKTITLIPFCSAIVLFVNITAVLYEEKSGFLEQFEALLRNGPDKNDSNNGNEHVGMQKRC